jgi:hypothetical protein
MELAAISVSTCDADESRQNSEKLASELDSLLPQIFASGASVRPFRGTIP